METQTEVAETIRAQLFLDTTPVNNFRLRVELGVKGVVLD